MPKKPLLSIIIPTYNNQRYIADAIESIEIQNYHSLEIIIIDDGSTDHTAEIIASYKKPYIHYIYQANQVVASARNTGLKKASGDIIGFLDADDMWTPNKLQLQLNYLQNQTKFQMVLGHTQLIKQIDESPDNFKTLPLPHVLLQLGAMLIIKDCFELVGLFDESLKRAEDIDWLLRAQEMGINIFIHDEIILSHRRHSTNSTNDKALTDKYFIKILASLIKRRKNNINKLPAGAYFENFLIRSTK
jgi:glycosyltransferase involved in cell wall biosynthesis